MLAQDLLSTAFNGSQRHHSSAIHVLTLPTRDNNNPIVHLASSLATAPCGTASNTHQPQSKQIACTRVSPQLEDGSQHMNLGVYVCVCVVRGRAVQHVYICVS